MVCTMSFGKTITMFLIEGDPNGRMTCQLSNWSGLAYKIPRIKIKDCTDRKDLTGPGVYMLFGHNEENEDEVYIGEAESILNRLNQHLVQKDFWNETVVFISKDYNLNKAKIKYLEHKLYAIAKKVNRYKLINKNIPSPSSLSESEEVEMNEFISNIKLIINALGHKVFEEIGENETTLKNKHYILKSKRNANAMGKFTSEGFLVFHGSKVSNSFTTSSPKYLKNLRNRLISQKILVNKKTYYEFTRDYIFGSPSTAAAVITGRSINGLTAWKDDEGFTLKYGEAKEGNEENK